MKLTINGFNNQYQSISLFEILKLLESKISSLEFRVLWYEGVMIENFGMDIREIEEAINKSRNGFKLDYYTLISFSKLILQEKTLLLIADNDKSKLKRYESDEEMLSEYSLILELVDSSY